MNHKEEPEQTTTRQATGQEGKEMKKYSALVKDGDRIVFIENQEYHTKADFIKDLRCNGYQVNPRKVKPSDVFDYIMNHTNCNPWDWDLKAVPAE